MIYGMCPICEGRVIWLAGTAERCRTCGATPKQQRLAAEKAGPAITVDKESNVRTTWDAIRYALLGAALAALIAFVLFAFTTRNAHADDLVLSGGTLLNNARTTGHVAPYVELTARKSTDFKDLEVYGTFTHVFRSDFGQHEHKGSAQFVSAGLVKPWAWGDWELRAGFGLLVAVHYDWGSHYKGPMTNETYKAECLFCGWTVPVALSWKRAELSLTYASTDPNFWTSYNGLRLGLGVRL